MREFSCCQHSRLMRHMKKIEDIRRENLGLLRAEAGGVQRLADRLGKSQSQVSQWLNASANSGSGKPRTISTASCREIERAIGKPEGWMDMQHQEAHVALVETDDAVELRRMLRDASAEIRLLSIYRMADSDQRKLIDAAVGAVLERLDLHGALNKRK